MKFLQIQVYPQRMRLQRLGSSYFMVYVVFTVSSSVVYPEVYVTQDTEFITKNETLIKRGFINANRVAINKLD